MQVKCFLIRVSPLNTNHPQPYPCIAVQSNDPKVFKILAPSSWDYNDLFWGELHHNCITSNPKNITEV